MRILVFNRSSNEIKKAEKIMKRFGHKISKRPEIVISLGGDGTFLLAERKYPGIPKVLVRSRSKLCVKCSNYSLPQIAKALSDGKFLIQEFYKVEAGLKGRKINGINEINIRNADPRVALRFNVRSGNEDLGNFIGDGVVVATSFGSSAYFYNLTGKTFSSGLGVSLNNTSRKIGPVITDSDITVKILREKATVTCDNGPILFAKPGDKIKIRKSKMLAKIVAI